MAVSDIFERWQKPSYVRLHAGEMSAQEMRSVVAVVKAVEAEITAALSDQVVVPTFKTGDRVKHELWAQLGTVTLLDNGNVVVDFDELDGKRGRGEYDADWFKKYPGCLALVVPASTPVRSS